MSRFTMIETDAVSCTSPTPGVQAPADPRVADIIASGEIWIGVFPSFQYAEDPASGRPAGLAVDIAQAFASHFGIRSMMVIAHPTPMKVIEDLVSGACDFGFMVIDPARSIDVDFTPPLVRSDFTFLAPACSGLRGAAEVDRPHLRVAAVRGHASTTALLRTIREASPVLVDSFDEAVEALRTGRAEAFATIREIALRCSDLLPGSRVLEDAYQANLAGIAVAKGQAGRLACMSEFLDSLKRTGALRRIIDRAGIRGVEIVPSSAEALS